MPRTIGPGDYVDIQLNGVRETYQISEIIRDQILIHPINQPQIKSQIYPFEGRWVISGAENLPYQLNFYSKSLVEQIPDFKLILLQLDTPDLLTACELDPETKQLCETEVYPEKLYSLLSEQQQKETTPNFLKQILDVANYLTVYRIITGTDLLEVLYFYQYLYRTGNLELLEILFPIQHPTMYQALKNDGGEQAVWYGHDQIIKFLKDNKITVPSRAYKAGLMNGHMKYINKTDLDRDTLIVPIARSGNLEALEDYINKNFSSYNGKINLSADTTIFVDAAMNGHLYVLQYVIGYAPNIFDQMVQSKTLTAALQNGRSNVITWLVENYNLQLPKNAADLVVIGPRSFPNFPFEAPDLWEQVESLEYLKKYHLYPSINTVTKNITKLSGPMLDWLKINVGIDPETLANQLEHIEEEDEEEDEEERLTNLNKLKAELKEMEDHYQTDLPKYQRLRSTLDWFNKEGYY